MACSTDEPTIVNVEGSPGRWDIQGVIDTATFELKVDVVSAVAARR